MQALHRMVWLQTASTMENMQKNSLLITMKMQTWSLSRARKPWLCPGETEEEEIKGQLQPTHCTLFCPKQNTHEYINSMGASQQYHYPQECRKCVKTVWVSQEIQVSMRLSIPLPPTALPTIRAWEPLHELSRHRNTVLVLRTAYKNGLKTRFAGNNSWQHSLACYQVESPMSTFLHLSHETRKSDWIDFIKSLNDS